MQVEIKKRLAKLHPTQLEIIDDSDLHRGHSGNNGGGHYTIK
ncbi:MAG: BolA/IbaG family iron-sulfur metabolism protein, partial [Methylophilaceae bacterium]